MAVSCRVCHSIDQEIPREKETVLSLDTVRWDTDNIKQGNRLVCNTPGVYAISAECIWQVCNASVCQLTIKLNGEKCIATDRQQGEFYFNPFNTCVTQWDLKKGDYLEMVVWYWIDPRALSMPNPLVRRADHWDSPEFMMTLLK